MTEIEVQRALRTAVAEAYRLGQQTGRHDPARFNQAMRYAEMMVLPMVTARVEQAIEDAHATEARLRLAAGASTP